MTAHASRILHTGEGRIMVAFSVPELEELALATTDEDVANRCMCAVGLLDAELEAKLREERAAVDADWTAADASGARDGGGPA